MKLIKYQFSIRFNGFLLQQQRFILVCKLFKNLVSTKSSTYSHILLQLFVKQRRIFKQKQWSHCHWNCNVTATANAIPLQLVCHCKCNPTATAMPPQLLWHCNCRATATAMPLQLLCHCNCYAAATATADFDIGSSDQVTFDKNCRILCGATGRTKRIRQLCCQI